MKLSERMDRNAHPASTFVADVRALEDALDEAHTRNIDLTARLDRETFLRREAEANYLAVAEASGAVHHQSMGPAVPGTVHEIVDAFQRETIAAIEDRDYAIALFTLVYEMREHALRGRIENQRAELRRMNVDAARYEPGGLLRVTARSVLAVGPSERNRVINGEITAADMAPLLGPVQRRDPAHHYRASIQAALGCQPGHELEAIKALVEGRAGQERRADIAEAECKETMRGLAEALVTSEERQNHANALQCDIEAEQAGRLALRAKFGAREDETFGAFIARVLAERDAAIARAEKAEAFSASLNDDLDRTINRAKSAEAAVASVRAHLARRGDYAWVDDLLRIIEGSES